MAPTGVLLMGFGGPDSLEAVEPFMTNLTGQAPSAETLERVRRRYLTIGGSSPLTGIADSIAGKLEKKLASEGNDVAVRIGMRYWRPFIADALGSLAAEGAGRIVTVSLSPLESTASSGAYRAAVAEAAAACESAIVEAPSFAGTSAFVSGLASACREALSDLKDASPRAVLFTAHSLPASETDIDGYVAGLRALATSVAEESGLSSPAETGEQGWLPGIDAFGSDSGRTPWLVAYQSKGLRPGEWLGPDVLEVVDLVAREGYEAVAFCPVGFATDHMETLYDLDVEAADRALEQEMEYARASVPNDGPDMIEALAEVVRPLLG